MPRASGKVQQTFDQVLRIARFTGEKIGLSAGDITPRRTSSSTQVSLFLPYRSPRPQHICTTVSPLHA